MYSCSQKPEEGIGSTELELQVWVDSIAPLWGEKEGEGEEEKELERKRGRKGEHLHFRTS